MDAQFRCRQEERRRLVTNHASLNGIDYLEVLDAGAPAGTPPQQTLVVQFLKPLTTPLDERNVRIERQPGAAVADVVWARRAVDAQELVDEGRIAAAERDAYLGLADADHIVVVRTSSNGDYSTYTLRLVTSPTDDGPPAGIDQRLAAIDFSFKVECPSDFDCKVDPECPPETFEEPDIDYLAKDYSSFRRLILDRLSVLMPDWRDRSPADLQVALVELLAYTGDYLSYFQDAVATEAYLRTARRRTSVRRHARLLDYLMHDGCNARAWVHLTVGPHADGGTLPNGTALRTRDDDALVFETMHDLALHRDHNEIAFYTWGDAECCLPRGSTRATLRNDPTLALQAGDVLVFEEVCDPETGLEADANPDHRHAVRLTEAISGTDLLDGTSILEVAWHEQDALPFPLCLGARIIDVNGLPEVKAVSVARGNVVLADQGRTLNEQTLVPDAVPSTGRYRPRLQTADVTFAVAFQPNDARDQAASIAIEQDPRQALPSVHLDDDDEAWQPRRDLLASDRFAADFVVETENDGRAYLRFGDDVLGKAPSGGTIFRATYRVGNGPAGNLGAEAIAEVVGFDGIDAVRNPLPAVGGTAPERIEAVRQFAPQAFRTQERAVTEADYAEVAERHADVQKAAATFRWTGSWYTVFVTIDRKGGLPVRADARFQHALRAHLNRFRLAGYDLELYDPVFVPLDLKFDVCVAPGYFQSDVKRSLLDVFSRRDLPDGRRGFFHPDRFTFGQPVYLSQLYQAAMEVSGVASIDVTRFQRLNENPRDELREGVLPVASLEIVRLDNDPSNPENGKIEFAMLNGL